MIPNCFKKIAEVMLLELKDSARRKHTIKPLLKITPPHFLKFKITIRKQIQIKGRSLLAILKNKKYSIAINKKVPIWNKRQTIRKQNSSLNEKMPNDQQQMKAHSHGREPRNPLWWSHPQVKNLKQIIEKSSRCLLFEIKLMINKLVKEVNNHKLRRKNRLRNKRKGLQIRLEIAARRKRNKAQAAGREIIFRSLQQIFQSELQDLLRVKNRRKIKGHHRIKYIFKIKMLMLLQWDNLKIYNHSI